MTDPAHSPHPFTLVKGCAGSHGHLILDAFSDSIAALAVKTGDHPPEEQLANAMLFVHSPHMLQALKAVHAVRPVNWDADEDPEAREAWWCVEACIKAAEGRA